MQATPAAQRYAFHGRVHCVRPPAPPLGLVLVGMMESSAVGGAAREANSNVSAAPLHDAGGLAQLAFEGSAPADLPAVLEHAEVTRAADGSLVLGSGARTWSIPARRVHLHVDARAAFARALPPCAAPLLRRLFWRLVLALAARGWGRRLLLARRSR